MEAEFKKLDALREIGIPNVLETDCTSWNLCGGSALLGCWFGAFLVPLIHKERKVKQRN